MPKACVKIMRSYDYNHFEVSISTDEDLTLEEIDEMRKDCARLVDKAVNQYQTFKSAARRELDLDLSRKAAAIKENFPKSEWTEQQKAVVKQHEDNIYWANREYDYQDDWDHE